MKISYAIRTPTAITAAFALALLAPVAWTLLALIPADATAQEVAVMRHTTKPLPGYGTPELLAFCETCTCVAKRLSHRRHPSSTRSGYPGMAHLPYGTTYFSGRLLRQHRDGRRNALQSLDRRFGSGIVEHKIVRIQIVRLEAVEKDGATTVTGEIDHGPLLPAGDGQIVEAGDTRERAQVDEVLVVLK